MNIAESMKHVLKNKSQNILTLLVKEDLKNIIKDFSGDVLSVIKKRKGISRNSLTELKYSIQGTVILLKAIPQRVNNGFKIFSTELMKDLDRLPDSKQKTIFCMKVLAGMSKLAVSSAYDVGLGDMKLLGIGKRKNVISSVLVTKLMFKTLKSLILRMVVEMEKEVTNIEDLKQLQGIKEVIMDDSINAIDKFFEGVTDSDHRAFAIVDNLKNYILTGKSC